MRAIWLAAINASTRAALFSEVANRQAHHSERTGNPSLANSLLEHRHDLASL
jgi:hypothetical protein